MFEKIKNFISSAHIESKATKKSNNTIALEVLCGEWGGGATRKKKLTEAGYNYDAIQKIVNDRMKKKSIDVVAKEVIDGKWGSGKTRKKCLEVAGYDYDAVQRRVNEILDPPKPTKSIDEIAHEVLLGKWGSGDERKKRLTEAGYDYNKVQARVNEIVAFQNKVGKACEEQTAWAYKSKYEWQSSPTVPKSKIKGTCVTYVACVLQRIGVLKSGQYIWHNGKGYGTGKVYGTTKDMTTTYYNNKKTLKDLIGFMLKGDIVLYDDNKSGDPGNGGHIEIYSGNGYKFYTGGMGSGHNTKNDRVEKSTRKVLAIVRNEKG